MPRKTVLQPTRPKQPVNPNLDKKLVAYVTAAGAASIAMFAAVTPAEGEIVYTPANVNILTNTPYPLDLNHDGTVDFTLEVCRCASDHEEALILELGTGNQAVLGAFGDAAALSHGTPIGPGQQFTSRTSYGGLFMAVAGQYSHYWFFGAWAPAVNKYLGLKFLINGEVHYGWARMTVTDWYSLRNGKGVIQLNGYAYETIANKGLPAGLMPHSDARNTAAPPGLGAPAAQPATLGTLAQGSGGLSLWRREEEAAA